MGLTDLHLKPAPGSMDLAQVLLHKGQGWQALLPGAQQPHAFWVNSEVVAADLLASALSRCRQYALTYSHLMHHEPIQQEGSAPHLSVV